MRRFLVTRTDRLGDVLLSLPAVKYLAKGLPKDEITFECQEVFHPLLKKTLDLWKVKLRSGGSFNEYDGILFLFSPGKRVREAKREQVRIRVGNYTKLESLFLSRGSFQRRSKGEKPEALYNLELASLFLRELGVKAPDPGIFAIRLSLDEPSTTLEKPYWVLHPGMGGSALNLSPKRYLTFLSQWPREKNLVVTVGPSAIDQRISKDIQKEAPWVKVLENLTLTQFAQVLKEANGVFAPATGPLHLAHFMGTPTFGFYSPLQSQARKRWAPWGGAGASSSFEPDVSCPAKRKCLGEKCPENFCMDKAPWESLIFGKDDAWMGRDAFFL